jgi:hypothetical protein
MIREALKRAAPAWALRQWFRVRELAFLRSHRGRKEVFAAIHAGNLWGNPETASGFGSTIGATEQARAGLQKLIAEHDIRSILDAPCGDFNWMRALQYDGDYVGADIVAGLVADNQRRYGNDRHRFVELDLVHDSLPPADLVLCRECLNHLSLAEAHAAVRRLGDAAKKILLITHYPAEETNADQLASFRYRPLNFTKSPFNLRQPDFLIDESLTEPGKLLAGWDIRRAQLTPE